MCIMARTVSLPNMHRMYTFERLHTNTHQFRHHVLRLGDDHLLFDRHEIVRMLIGIVVEGDRVEYKLRRQCNGASVAALG